MDKQSFVDAIDQRSGQMYRVAKSLLINEEDVRDALQECALKAWTSRHTLRDEACFGGWLVRILIHVCRTMQRKQIRNRMVVDAACEATRLQDAFENARDPGLSQALMRLPEKLRLAVVLHYMEGYSMAEIASMLRIPQSTVRGRMYQARKKLRVLLEEGDAV